MKEDHLNIVRVFAITQKYRIFLFTFPLLSLICFTTAILMAISYQRHLIIISFLLLLLAGCMIFTYTVLKRMRLVFYEHGIVYYGWGYRLYTPWHNLVRPGHTYDPMGFYKYNGIHLHQQAETNTSIERGMRRNCPVLERDWWHYEYRVVPFLNMFPINEAIGGKQWEHSEAGQLIGTYAPYVFEDAESKYSNVSTQGMHISHFSWQSLKKHLAFLLSGLLLIAYARHILISFPFYSGNFIEPALFIVLLFAFLYGPWVGALLGGIGALLEHLISTAMHIPMIALWSPFEIMRNDDALWREVMTYAIVGLIAGLAIYWTEARYEHENDFQYAGVWGTLAICAGILFNEVTTAQQDIFLVMWRFLCNLAFCFLLLLAFLFIKRAVSVFVDKRQREDLTKVV